MSVIHVSAECFPVAKVGGLADVVGALPIYQNNLGIDSKVIMPYYANAYTKKRKFDITYKGKLKLGEISYDFQILKLKADLGFPLFLVKIRKLLDLENVYGYDNDTERFLAFQIAVLNWVIQTKVKPSLIHCHDNHTGIIPFMMSHVKKYASLKNIPTILTIHNAQYQGQFGYKKLHLIPMFDKKHVGLLDWDGLINPLASGIKCAWKVTTVSPSYLVELTQKANGLESLLAHEKSKSVGILNGIDTKIWNPETDKLIVKNYAKNNIQSGKKVNKNSLCKRFDLDRTKPLFSFIGRLVYEKGADLFPDIFYKALLKNDINILVLGSGDKEVEAKLKSLNNHFKNKYNSFMGYDEELAHQIYAGSDFLLMPSRVEPCGLNQMYALRYGTIPVVRRIGGLKDTVIDIGDGGFGICHDQVSVEDVCSSMVRAVDLYNDQSKFKKIRNKSMQIDHSWDKSTKEYISLYNSIIP
jgi:starch synthase